MSYKQIDDGGPAFPLVTSAYGNTQIGMSLRDHFAVKAMQAMLANGDTGYDSLACESYAIADAMLAERNKGRKS